MFVLAGGKSVALGSARRKGCLDSKTKYLHMGGERHNSTRNAVGERLVGG